MPIRVEFTEVKSSNLQAVAHVEGRGLYVTFVSGKTYRYPEVPADVHDAIVAESNRRDGSVGRAFRKLVKAPGYEYEEVPGV